MALLIQTTGLEEYAPGGKARVKVLMIGGPGAGKTRWSSYFPKPVYADCERGLASVADRQVPYVNVNTSQDMLDLLAHLKLESQIPPDKRQFETVVIDTLDAFQRKVKNEWMEREKKQTFTGWEAWGFLNSRMQMLMTRLLNLDMNVIVNVHYKDRVTKDDATGKESHELMLQLQGETADTAFNDFDLVGWMGTYWEAVDGERVQKRGITFKPKPDRPFLKDRLHVTPDWLEVQFEPTDYTNLFERIQAKAESLGQSEVVGEVATAVESVDARVVAPGAAGAGALPNAGSEAVKLAYSQLDKPSLLTLIRERQITSTVDEMPIKGNTLKAELIAALEAHDAASATTSAAPTEAPGRGTTPDPAAQPAQPDPAPSEKVANPRRLTLIDTEAGYVDKATGEVMDKEAPPTGEQAVATVAKELGGQVIAEAATPVAPVAASPAPAPDKKPAVACEACGKDITDEDSDIAKLSWIKFRKRLCENDFAKAKAGR